MKKRWIILAFLFIINLSFVSAYDGWGWWGGGFGGGGAPLSSGEQMIYDSISWFQVVFGPYLEALFGPGYLLEKMALLLVLISFIYIAVSRIPPIAKNKSVVWIITLSVSLLATRFFSDIDLFRAVLVPYEIYGVAVASILPLILYFFFIESFDSHVIRKIGWIVFICIFFGLWVMRMGELGNIAWIYFAVAIISLIFLMFDKAIHAEYIYHFLMKAGKGYAGDAAINQIRTEMFRAEDMLANPHASEEDRKRARGIIKQCKRRIKEIVKSGI
ncbi:hypothetical protein FJZ19_03215 [Candidatus Pacearchaeota archaeon]|nr:hypothetical protein [Candidatus Pacearchaeota archaeon]